MTFSQSQANNKTLENAIISCVWLKHDFEFPWPLGSWQCVSALLNLLGLWIFFNIILVTVVLIPVILAAQDIDWGHSVKVTNTVFPTSSHDYFNSFIPHPSSHSFSMSLLGASESGPVLGPGHTTINKALSDPCLISSALSDGAKEQATGKYCRWSNEEIHRVLRKESRGSKDIIFW